MSTATEGTKQNNAPPAALLAPAAHDMEAVLEMQSLNVQLLTLKLDDRPINGKTLTGRPNV